MEELSVSSRIALLENLEKINRTALFKDHSINIRMGRLLTSSQEHSEDFSGSLLKGRPLNSIGVAL